MKWKETITGNMTAIWTETMFPLCVNRDHCLCDDSDVTSKVGDHVKFDEASPFFLVNLCQHQKRKNVMSTIMKTMIFSSFLCIFAKF